jgi:hypothetical protein
VRNEARRTWKFGYRTEEESGGKKHSQAPIEDLRSPIPTEGR